MRCWQCNDTGWKPCPKCVSGWVEVEVVTKVIVDGKYVTVKTTAKVECSNCMGEKYPYVKCDHT